MPAVAPPAKILVTGANGYIALWIVRLLLEHGYSVRGTARSESKTKTLRTLFRDEMNNGKLELAVVPDILHPGAFDEVVKDVDAILHTASPFTFEVDDPEELIGPAVKGTVGILESAMKSGGTRLKRIVVLSSVASIIDSANPGVLNDDCWNESSIAAVKEKGRSANNMDKYFASKTLAEKAAWEFVSKNGKSFSWDLVTLCPPFVFGPVLGEVASPKELGTSMGQFYASVVSKEETPESLKQLQASWTDVRDVAFANVRALEVPEAGGQRFLVSAEEFIFQDFLDAAHGLSIERIKQGTPGAGKDFKYVFTCDSSKARKVLGITFRDLPTMLKDTVEDLRARGW